MFKSFFLIITCALAINCQVKQESDKSNRINYAVFVEAKTNKTSISAGNFGEITLLDIASGKKKYLTDDIFFDSEPSISFSGDKIVFKSTRYYKESDQRFIGASSLGGIYVYNLNNDKILDITDKLSVEKRLILKRFRWGKNDELIFYIRDGREIYGYNFNTNDNKNILELNSEITIRDFLYAPKCNCLILNQSEGKSYKSKLMVFEITSKKWTQIDSIGVIKIYSINDDDNFIFSRNKKIFNYNLVNGAVDYLFDLYINDNIYVRECFRLNETEYLILGGIENTNRLLLYNSNQNEIQYLTNGQRDLEYLDVFLSK